MNRRTLTSAAIGLLLLLSAVGLAQHNKSRRKLPPKGAVCGDPTVTCKTSYPFEAHDLPFQIPTRVVITESEPFYAVILTSIAAPNDDCEKIVPEAERLQVQALFPHNKVFTSHCSDAGTPYYTGLKPDTHIMAIYAGRTHAEAEAVLAQVKATGKYADAYLRRTSIGFNGT
jgi:hypothetical protein